MWKPSYARSSPDKRHPAVRRLDSRAHPWVVCAWLASSAPVHAQVEVPSVKAPTVERYALSNGLEVVLQQDLQQSTVAGVVAYRVGLRDDPRGYEGLAHLVEHMTFRGSLHLPERLGAKTYEAVGAGANGMTTPDFTIYWAEVPAANVSQLLWIESDRMGFALDAMDDTQLEIERKIVRNEERQRMGTWQRIRTTIQQTGSPETHPYHHIADKPLDPAEIKLDDVRWFFQRNYRPDNASLVLVGNFDLAGTRKAIERYFGPLRASQFGSRPRAPAIVFDGSERLRFESSSYLPSIRVRWSIPCGDDLGCHARTRLLAFIVTSLLNPGTRSDEKKIQVGLQPFEQHVEIEVVANLMPGDDAERVLGQIDDSIARLQRGEVDPTELRMAQLAQASEAFYERESPLSRAAALAMELYARDAAIEAAMKLDASEIASAAVKMLPRDRRLVTSIARSRSAGDAGDLKGSEGNVSPRAIMLQKRETDIRVRP